MDLILAYAAGLLTLINPCILPVLPIVLASSLEADRRAPLALAAGMSLSFVVLGVGITAAGPALGLDPDGVARGAAVVMALFGLILLLPALGGRVELALAGLAARADARLGATAPAGLGGQAVGGALLGAVWSPCIGPTLGAAIALAAQGQNLGQATLVMAAFAGGVSTLILVLATGARAGLARRPAGLRRIAEWSRPVTGAVFVVVGLVLAFRLHHPVEAWLLDRLPPWLVDLSVAL